MKSLLTTVSVSLLFVAVAVPHVASAEEPGRFITARSDEDALGVNEVTLELTHRSADQDLIDDGTIDAIELEYDVDTAFNNPTAVSYSIAEVDAAGDYSSRVFRVTVTGLVGVKGYYFRARLVNTLDEVAEWKETSRTVTLPAKPKNLRVPKKLKNSFSIALKWDHPRRCQAEGCDYFVKVFNNRKKNKDLVVQQLVSNNSSVTFSLSSGIALGKKYKFKVQSCLSSSLCNPKFSKPKKFKR